MRAEIDGFDELRDELERMTESALGLDGSTEVPMTEMMSSSFMQRYTDFESIAAFFDSSPWTVEDQSDFDAIPDDGLDNYVRDHTQFSSWDEMVSKAGSKWAERQLK
jgi:hypothetical protein